MPTADPRMAPDAARITLSMLTAVEGLREATRAATGDPDQRAAVDRGLDTFAADFQLGLTASAIYIGGPEDGEA